MKSFFENRFFSPSNLAMITVFALVPKTFVEVLSMSKNLSTIIIIAIASLGIPSVVITIISVIKQPEGQEVIVTRGEFNQAVQDKVKGKITDDQFKVISDNFQRSIAAGKVA